MTQPMLDHRTITQYGTTLDNVFVPLDLLYDIQASMAPSEHDFMTPDQQRVLTDAGLISKRSGGVHYTDTLRQFVDSLETQRQEEEERAAIFGNIHTSTG